LRCSESRKVTLGRIVFLSAAFVFSASHPSAADFTRLQERVKLGCGKVEFCLPTKLRAPSLAERVIGHVGRALNAFGLFALEAPATLEAKRSDLGVYDSRFGEPEHRITVRLTEEHVAQVEVDRGKKWLLSGNRKSIEKAF
jgi:hypothetical protein